MRFRAISSCFCGGPLRLLDELVQHDDPSSDERAVEHSRQTFRRLEPEFEKAVTHGPGVRHSEVGAVQFHAFGIPKKARHETGRQLKQLFLERCAVERDSPVHRCNYSKYAIVRLVEGSRA